MTGPSSDRLARILAAYDEALQRQPLAANTRRAYRVRVHQYGDYLCSQPEDYGNPLQDRRALSLQY